MKKLYLFVILAGIFAGTILEANATHWRYGHLTWKPNPSVSPTTVEFTFIAAFRRTAYTGSAMDGRPAVGDTFLESLGGTGLQFGDGGSTGILRFVVIAIDPPNDWLLAQALQPGSMTKTTIDRTYPSATNGGNPWVAAVVGCCRISTSVNNPDGQYRVETQVELVSGNQSPVSSLPAIVNLVKGPASSFFVPAADADPNTTLVWRLATAAEAAAGGSFSQPTAGGHSLSIDATTGLATWNTTAALTNRLYSCQVIIEDRNATTNDLKTKVGVDFLIFILECPPDNTAPEFVSPTPACGSVLTAYVGVPFSFMVEASDPDMGDEVILNSAGLPTGAVMDPGLPMSGNPVSSEFQWTPTAADIGSYVVTYSATDECGAQVLCSFTIAVEAEPPVTACPFSQGYWRNHPDDWPSGALPMMLGTVNDYDQSELLAIFNTPPRGDASLILAHQLIAAKLNVANFSPVPSDVADAIANADAAIGALAIPAGIRPGHPLRATMLDLASLLDDYNNNVLTPDCEHEYKSSSIDNESVTTVVDFINYPNPFNQFTRISWNTLVDGMQTVKVYDAMGREVAILVDEYRAAGGYEVVFDASDLSGGIYIYRIQIVNSSLGSGGDFIQTNKMILLK